jgi:two-component system, chemotaxis family, chemotaxis protein CheY
MKFLVVDDSTTMRRIVIHALQRLGYSEFVEASDGHEALAKFDSSVKFIITDWKMPIMSGTEMVHALRQRDDGRTVPVLLITSRVASDNIISVLELGASNYIMKPFTPHVLKEKIASVLLHAVV